MKQVPGQRRLHLDKVDQRARLAGLSRKLAMLHVESLRGDGEEAPIESVAAEQDVIDVHFLDQSIDAGAGRLHLGRNTGAIVSAQPVLAGQRERWCRMQGAGSGRQGRLR